MQNTGTTSWTAAGGYKLGSQNPKDNLTWGLSRVLLASGETIAPGATKTFSFTVKAPTTAGTYNFQWRMVQEAVQWFGGSSTNVAIAVSGATATLPVKLFPGTVPGYEYSPSYMVDGNTEKVWWCGLDPRDGAGDVIGYRERPVGGSWGAVQTVLYPNDAGWEGIYACDPAVVKGQFAYGGTTYSYALYYTAWSGSSTTENAIGVAFSNNGRSWVKYANNPIITSQAPGTGGYGAGEAQVYNSNGQAGLWLFHTDTSPSFGTRQFLRTTTDGIHFGAPQATTMQGLPSGQNMGPVGWAYDYQAGYWYFVSGRGNPVAGEVETLSIFKIPASGLFSGTWTKVADIPNAQAAPFGQFEAGFKTDIYGNLTPFLPRIITAFGGGNRAFVNGGFTHASEWELYTATTQ
ncbi:MAG: hypothetical protein HYZ92_04385, partial [Candidatus Omnitrophica bacterium]|nr:hypothetical protein [Candidatus Omnitrophota bacterium]